jgi:hypothetical protein
MARLRARRSFIRKRTNLLRMGFINGECVWGGGGKVSKEDDQVKWCEAQVRLTRAKSALNKPRTLETCSS